MESQVITEFGKPLQRIEGPTPEPKGTEVLVRVEHCGVCHSDIHIHDGYFGLGGEAKLPLRPAAAAHPGPRGRRRGDRARAGCEGVKVGDHRALYSWIGCGTARPACAARRTIATARATSAARPARPAATPATSWSRIRAT